MDHVISIERSHSIKDESKNDGETSRGHDQTVVPTDVSDIPSSMNNLNIRNSIKFLYRNNIKDSIHDFTIESCCFLLKSLLLTHRSSGLLTSIFNGFLDTLINGFQKCFHPDFPDWTSPGSDWVLNRCNIPMELRSSLDDMGYPIEKNEGNPTEVTCPKVPLMLRKNPRSKDYFDPTAISLGPYHHGERELQEINTIKTVAMLKFIKESDKSFPEFYYKVRNMNHLTRACYVDCSEEKYCDDTFALIMLRDGCFISYLLDIVVDKKWDKVTEVFVNHGGLLGYASVIRDMVLLENQIPLAVLELLMSLRYNNKKVVPIMIKQFIYFEFLGISLEEVPKDINEEPQAHCLLECIQKEFSKVVDGKKERRCFNFVPSCRFRSWNPFANSPKEETDLINLIPSYRSLSELKAKGIHFKPRNYSPHSFKKRKLFSVFDIEFIPGFFYSQLKLSPMALGPGSVILWNNLIAFELSPASKTDIVLVSYISFLNALIANPDDVKELRSKRILLNFAGSDEEMFKFFKEISTGSVQDISIYRHIREEIEKHCRSNTRTWAAEIIYKYFRNPWSALGLFAAIAVVVLSFVQTYFTIYPVKD